ncbi:hypothetical protein J1N35_013671 [Gossypium stocksii]|uniref:RNase H type-1 domain-containing protein n=1 Tax=Gossypium stocksii TaxID=47602 RepID=A0A9D3VTD5_9ROSI|nr:hypothetical protein J1N35_013671 [Gossypium stocksii]
MGSASCRRCQNGAESREHVFRDYPIANEAWTKLGFSWPSQDENSDFNEWLNNVFELYSLNQCRVFAYTLWALWSTINRFIHEGEVKSGSQTADFVKNYINELDGLSSCLPVNRLPLSRWATPTDSWLKINFDAAFKKERKESCLGLVVRNTRDEAICSKMVFHENIPSAFATETMACLQAIRLGLHLGLRKVEIEGDSRTVIRKLQEEGEDRSEIEVFIQDSRYLSLDFESCDFKFVSREANKVAHLITKEGINKGETTYLQNAVFTGVEEALMEDRRWMVPPRG